MSYGHPLTPSETIKRNARAKILSEIFLIRLKQSLKAYPLQTPPTTGTSLTRAAEKAFGTKP